MSTDQTTIIFANPDLLVPGTVGSPNRQPAASPNDVRGVQRWKEIHERADRVIFVGEKNCRIVIQQDSLVPARKSQLHQRCRILSLLDSSHFLAIRIDELNQAPPSLTVDLPGNCLDDQITNLTSDHRMTIAGELIAAVRDAHRIGMFGSRLDQQGVYLKDDSHRGKRIQWDCLGLLSAEPIAWDTFGYGPADSASDLIALSRLIKLLLEHLINEPSADLLRGRQRIILQKLVNRQSDDVVEIDEWMEALSQWVPSSSADSFSNAAGFPADDLNDQTGVFQVDSIGGTHDSSHTDQISVSTQTLQQGTRLGRFQIEDHIGDGGMGAVYRATDLSNHDTVAVKVLRPHHGDIVQAVRRFRKEARLLAEVQNDYVTRLYQVGEQDGTHYMAMEYVAGTNLKSWCSDRLPLSEIDALKVASDVARALVEAHCQNIVHRDIKPENILLNQLSDQNDSIRDFRIKLSDFGIARHIDQSSSLEVTQAGSMLGTPRYMSPEQCKGSDAIAPTADVYSLGITLYELLTGSPPFVSSDPMRVAAMHCFDTPDSVQTVRNSVSDAAARIVAKAISKAPEQRFVDAAEMLREMERVIRGEPAEIEAHPRTPASAGDRVWAKTMSWNLESSADELWPFVSNTERLNRALGLPPVNYRTQQDPQRGIRKFGSFRLAGIDIQWEEHPFEWIESRRMGVLREFESGPFKWFMSIVTLDANGEGTKLSHEVRIEPRNVLGKVIAKIEADWKGFRSLDRVYRRIDRSIQGKLKTREGTDPFEPPAKRDSVSTARLDRLVDEVSREGVDPTIASAIADHLRETPPQPLAAMRPHQLADELGIEFHALLDACFVAASKGMLTIRWEVICPTCRVAAETFDALSSVDAHTQCEACNVSFRSNVAESIELVFRPHPEIVKVDDGDYCVGGPEHSPHIVAQLRLEPGERIEVDLPLTPGDYLIRSTRIPRPQRFRVKSSGAPARLDAQVLDFGSCEHAMTIRSGAPVIVLTNDDDTLHVIKVERAINRDECVTASMAASIQRFRTLFPEQQISTGNAITSEQISLVATEITNVDQLYVELGDTDAYARVRGHQEIIADTVRNHGGTVIRTAGESTLSAFQCCDDAVRAAIEIDQHLTGTDGVNCHVGIGVHRGHVLIAAENNRNEFFGGAVRATLAMPNKVKRGILLSETVFADPVIARMMPEISLASSVDCIDLPGLPNQHVIQLKSIEAADD